ncbi:MAG: hypothetical protein EOP88_02550 [Verrucomicrobiaceae bacterium]|nr:MAG: hypothetical protein EOP88_02550 [Verrucomicrobiaceae bacterium]
MSHDPTSIEQDLRELRAATLDDAFLERLESAAEGTLVQLTREEIRFEEFLREKSPAPLAPDFMAALEGVVQGVPFPVNEKIVLFPKGTTAPAARRSRPMWSAAAAVALIGAATALLMPGGRPAGNNVASQETKTPPPAVSAPAIPSSAASNFVPASFDRGLKEVHDEGVVYQANKPHTRVRVVYMDRVTLNHPDGRTYQVEVPKEKYVMVPARTD